MSTRAAANSVPVQIDLPNLEADVAAHWAANGISDPASFQTFAQGLTQAQFNALVLRFLVALLRSRA